MRDYSRTISPPPYLTPLITNNDKTASREEVRALGVWCQENNLTLNVNKAKEMIMDLRKQQREQPPIYIEGTAVENVKVPRRTHHRQTEMVHPHSVVKKMHNR